jgi:hypothetical protein
MAAARQDEHADPAMDPAEDPDLLIEVEGECKGNLGRRSTLKRHTGEGGSKVNIQN